MRKVIINDTPPQDWVDKAEKITKALCDSKTELERKDILDKHEGFWRDDRMRDWLLEKFANKCWYTESLENISSYHVDHFRPKGRITNPDKTKEQGYWWLTFEWRNYVISGQLINTKKSDKFPLLNNKRRAEEKCKYCEVELEPKLLIDPKTEQTRLISYEAEEGICFAKAAENLKVDEIKMVENTIDILGLNRLDRLNTSRYKVWDDCMRKIFDYEGYTRDKDIVIASALKEYIIKVLKEKISYEAEFSSIAEACIRKNAPESLVASVFAG